MFFSKVILKSTLSQIAELEKFIDSIMLNYNIEEQYRGVISVPLVESVKNAISHGNGNDESKRVTVAMQVQNSKLKFSVEDEGKGFDYQSEMNKSMVEKLGRGLSKVELLTQNVGFEKNGACITYSVDVPFKVMMPQRTLNNAHSNISVEQYI